MNNIFKNILKDFDIYQYNVSSILLILAMLVTTSLFIICMERNKSKRKCIYDPNTIKWTSPPGCSINSVIKKALTKNGMKKTTSNCDWDVYIPCTYNKLNKQIRTVPKNLNDGDKTRKVFVIDNADELCSKNNIWRNLVKSYGRTKASKMMPMTYILNNKDDMKYFKNEYNKNKLYILKKNIQRQKGLLITNDIDTITKASRDRYVVVQELLQDSYLIDDRKINLRVYILIVCNKGAIETYIYNDGFVYYTADKFKKGSSEYGPNITTGYIDRKVYEHNPLTHMDLRYYFDNKKRLLSKVERDILSKKEKISHNVFNSIYNLIKDVVRGMDGIICKKNSSLYDTTSFQLLGADIAINDNLTPQLIEINKGPDLGAKDDRDSALKASVVNDMLKVLKIIRSNDIGGYIKV
jgi:tubulin polyglutamylase TTLL5